MLLLMDMETDLFPSIFDNFPYCARSDPLPRTLHQFGFSSNIAAQLRQTGGSPSIEGDGSSRRWRVREGACRRSDARDRSSRKRRGDGLRARSGRKETRESQDKFAPRVTVWPHAAGQTSARLGAMPRRPVRSANNPQLHRECSRRWRRASSSRGRTEERINGPRKRTAWADAESARYATLCASTKWHQEIFAKMESFIYLI